MLSEIEASRQRRKNKTMGEKQIFEYTNYRKPPS